MQSALAKAGAFHFAMPGASSSRRCLTAATLLPVKSNEKMMSGEEKPAQKHDRPHGTFVDIFTRLLDTQLIKPCGELEADAFGGETEHRTRILIVDDHQVVDWGIRSVLEDYAEFPSWWRARYNWA